MGYTGIYWDIMGSTGIYWDVMGSTGFFFGYWWSNQCGVTMRISWDSE